GARPHSEPDPWTFPTEQLNKSIEAQRAELERRRQELGAELRAYKNAPPSRERYEAERELSYEIWELGDRIRLIDADPAGLPKGNDVRTYPPSFTYTPDASFAIGFRARDLKSRQQLASSNLGVPGGVWISEVEKGSAADRAGLQAGDVILGTAEKQVLT